MVARKDVYERVRDMARGGRHCGPNFPFFSPPKRPPKTYSYDQQYVKLTEFVNIAFVASNINYRAILSNRVHRKSGFFKLN